jgi:C4-dicarboxylate-specific signal transduction histidine kinase
MVDRRGRVIYCNERFRSVVASGREADDILRAPELRGADPILAFAGGGGGGDQSIEVDLEVIEADKATRFLHFSVSSQALPDIGRCTILVGHDETLRHQAQSAIAQTAKLVTLGEMTSGMAHELSQPLNVIRMAAQNALSEIEPAEAQDRGEEPPSQLSEAEFRPFVAAKLARIVAQVDRAASIIARMRVFGRTPDGPPRPYDARDACRGAMALVGQRLRNGGITVHEVLDEPLMVHGQQNLLEQVLVNLLLNARDALRDSERNDKVIELLAKRGGAGRILLTVTDNGPGIPPEIRERIFEPFFTSKPTGRGTGLGLSLSFGIVREAGGTLSLLPGTSGTAFQIDLPADSTT